MRPKKEEKVIMRQKVNVNDALLKSWVDNFLFEHRQIINPSKLTEEDLGLVFEHKDRHFEIIGMSSSGTVMLRETREEGIFYWECTRFFVQMKLARFVQEFYKIKGKLQTRSIAYPEPKMYLSPLNVKPKKEEEPEEDLNEEISEMVSFVEDSYDEKEND
jgi:hypothetical protein